MAKNFITGIGGVFIKSKDPSSLYEWYKKSLGIPADAYGAIFEWRTKEEPQEKGTTVWSLFKDKTQYFAPSEKEFMINFRVKDLDGLLEQLKKEGIEPLAPVEDSEYGRFAHIIDPEGTKLELWEPKDDAMVNPS